MEVLTCRRLHVQRAKRTVLLVDELALEEGETLAVIGPNGAGKSTLLLALAGLLPHREGEICFRQRPIDPRDDLAYRRQIGLVLQAPLLLDASVKENVAAGLRFRRLRQSEVDRRVDEWLANLGIAHLRDRPARRLSGGEAQRVSLARAFALQPDILLLDEPFGALDTPTRARLLGELHGLLRQTHTTTVFVTHNLDEASLLGSRVAVLLDGRVRQVGTPQAVFTAPCDPGVAQFVGVENVIKGVVIQVAAGWVTVAVGGWRLRARGRFSVGEMVWCCLRPEDIVVGTAEQAGGPGNLLRGVVRSMAPQGPLVRVWVDCGFPLVAWMMRPQAQQMMLREGAAVVVHCDAAKLHLIGDEKFSDFTVS
ncbi:MAG: ABC transporter ATP-binding protein [Chloroflexota bacterium]